MAAALDIAQNAIHQFDVWATNFDCKDLARVLIENIDVPIYAAGIYLAMVFWGQTWMKDRTAFNLKPFFIVWNLILAAFSITGCYFVLPYFLRQLAANGFRYTVCHDAQDWWANGFIGAWMGLFGLSKVPELVDTIFLVFQKKPVIFLHWYHHTTVMLYCWFAYTTTHTAGVWFGTMNYFVHSIMYSYYFLMSVSTFTRAMVRPFAMLITILQIAQMVAGLVIVIFANVYQRDSEGCAGNPPTIMRAALVMYSSYFILFANFFVQSYMKGGKKQKDQKMVKKTN